jgi:hypothetical protein
MQVIVTPQGAAIAVPSAAPSGPSVGPSLGTAMSTGGYVRSLLRRPFPNPLAFMVEPRNAPIVLSVAGGVFWFWAFGIFMWLCIRPLRHTTPPDSEVASVASAASTAGELPAATPPTAPAPASTMAEHAASPGAAPAAGSAPFHNAAAIRALDGKWREVAKCRRGKAWGKASTTVTFANDGSVSHIDVGSPFAGTPTADCIVDTLSGTRVEPFDDPTAVLVYKVYVAPR